MASMPQKVIRAASAARIATLVNPTESNMGWLGVIYHLNITAAPNTAATLTFVIEALDPASGNYAPLTSFPAIAGTAAQTNPTTVTYVLFPSATETVNVTNLEAQSLLLPTQWRTRVVHSDGSSWTYSIGEHLVMS